MFRRRCTAFLTSFEREATRPRISNLMLRQHYSAQQANDPYKLLGVGKSASDQEIKKAYFKLAKQWHPDVNPTDEAKEKFAEISGAYEILSDKDKRAQYDMFGSTNGQGFPNGFGQQGFAQGGFQGFERSTRSRRQGQQYHGTYEDWQEFYEDPNGSYDPNSEYYYDRDTKTYRRVGRRGRDARGRRGRTRSYEKDPRFAWEDITEDEAEGFEAWMRQNGFEEMFEYEDSEDEEWESRRERKARRKAERERKKAEKEERKRHEREEKARREAEKAAKRKAKKEAKRKEKVDQQRQQQEDKKPKEPSPKPAGEDAKNVQASRELERLKRKYPFLVVAERAQRPAWKQRCHRDEEGNYQVQETLTFKEAIHGCKKNVELRRMEKCETCDASGMEPGTSPVVCQHCRGAGRIRTNQGFLFMEQICTFCQGEGSTFIPCRKCDGNGLTPKHVRLAVAIMAGVQDEMKVKIPNQGDASRYGGARGSVYVHIRVQEDPVFVRHNNDAHIEVMLPLSLAVTGGEVEVPTLDGGTKMVELDPGVQHGDTKIIRSQGVKDFSSRVRGHLYVHFRVEIPKKITDNQKKIMSEWAKDETSEFKVIQRDT